MQDAALTPTSTIKASTMKPFAAGDIFLGCTYLMNVPGDDHAGEGRILQFDRNLCPRAPCTEARPISS
jgi:hypothetical protein